MRPKSRSRVTNKPPANAPTRSTKATARRVRDLFTAYLERLGPGPHDHVIEAGALRWAELTAICETLRPRALAGEEIDVNAITRLESTVNRAERALVKGVADIDAGNDPYSDFLREQEEDERAAKDSK
jgi:hypothetical protein